MEDMVSDGTTIKYHLWNEVYYRNDMWWGAEHNDQRMDSKSKLKIEISEKKKKRICVFLMEKGRKRPPAAFKLGGVGGAERSRNVLLAIKS